MKIFMPYRVTPIHDAQAALRKISTLNKEIPSVAPDGIYGTKTTDAVFAFQRLFMHLHGGEIDYHTWLHLGEELKNTTFVYSRPLPIKLISSLYLPMTIGASGSDVYLLQVILSRLAEVYVNLHPVAITGVYDIITKQAVADFQLLIGIPSTGDTDKKTWNSLSRIYSTIE